MATEWYMEGLYMKNCNCDPGCPCDFNQRPTQGFCEGMLAMNIDRGHFGDVDLSGVTWGGVVHWPGPIHEGDGEVQPIVDESASEEQRGALFEILSGKHGDSLMEVIAFVCPTVHEPIFAPTTFEIDVENRTARFTAGDVMEAEVETLRGIDPPDPYRILIKVPEGMEYTNDDESTEVAQAKRVRFDGAIKLDITDGHSSLCFVRHGSAFRTGKHEPTVVEKAFG